MRLGGADEFASESDSRGEERELPSSPVYAFASGGRDRGSFISMVKILVEIPGTR